MSNKINNIQQLREEINRLKQTSEYQKTAIKNSVGNFRRSMSPKNIISSVMSELNKDKIFTTALTAFEKLRGYFKKG